jgi:hypothetical protein
MCNISRVRLEVGREASGLEFARVTCRISFSQTERDLNLRFRTRALLYERDETLDVYTLGATTSTTQIPRGNRDDLVGSIGSQSVRPDGQAFQDLEFRRAWNFGDQESGNEEYRAIVRAIPDIRGDIAVSSEVSANLG